MTTTTPAARVTAPTTGLRVLSELMVSARRTGAEVHAPADPTGRPLRRTVTGRGPEGPLVPVSTTAPAARVAALDDVLAARVSSRFYTEDTVDAAVLGSALAAGFAADRALWDDAEWATAPQVVVAALRVAGLEPGLYRYDADAPGYVRLAHLDREAVAEMVLQMEYADAPVIIAAVSSIADSTASRGDHGMRLMHTRAGALCYSTLLAANARGVSGSVFAGFLASGLAAHLNTDGHHLAQVFAVSLGHPVPPPDLPTG